MSRLYAARTLLNAGVAIAALTAPFSIAPAFAQDAPAADQAVAEDMGDDIIVSARRRDERLIDVPIAITAFSGAQLEAVGALDITDISNVTPNVTLETSRGTNSTLSAFIRGVGQQDPVAGFEAGVGIYLDDVYLNRPQAAVLDIYDVERIEVLRGPQGTLYGRNTIGGAVKYVSRRIGDDPTLNLRASYGSYNQADGVISASTPIGNTGFKVGAAVARLSRGGFGDNFTTGQENYNKDLWGARGTIQYEPSSSAFFRLSGDYTKDNSNARGGHRLIPGLASGAPVLTNVYDSRGGLAGPKQQVEAYGGSFFAELKPADFLTFRSITGYRKDDSSSPIDFDALPAVDVDVPAFYNNKQFSQEVQLLIDTGPFNALVGLYYLDAEARTVFDVRLPGTVTALTFGNVRTDTVAIFADATYDVTPSLSLSVGGRYTWDNRNSQIQRNVYLGSSPFFGGTTAPLVRQTDFRGAASFQKFTPRASITFKPNADNTLYASYAKGFKGGGFDPRGVGTAAPDLNGNGITGAGGDRSDIYNFLSFDPETVESYEIGYKASLFDRRLTLALAGFHSNYTDVQVPGSVGAIVGGIQTFIGITTNAGKARINGLEAEANLTVIQGAGGEKLTLAGTVGYIDAKYTKFIDSRGINVAANRKFQNTPDLTASGTVALSLPIASGSVDMNSTVSYRSDSQQFELRTPGLDQPKYALLDANIVYNINDQFSIGVHGKNLTNKRYIVSGYNFLLQNPDTGAFLRTPAPANALRPSLGAEGVLTAYYGNPRQVFATFTAKF
ncbi:TonB-dependent receptor [Sphingomonas sp. So64.6b]|uniref:TonB-dependent receptor n=1 Tax=Sphingomonas sp. So64.6b TaxID=2997354 RepID=UPI00160167C7|nr:TonB-dependent receptor [Sphingomonas sp. So64.6b]QNA85958.1 TonB-dependent receptor [Sphingomonas sp. So64.6b]